MKLTDLVQDPWEDFEDSEQDPEVEEQAGEEDYQQVLALLEVVEPD